MFKRFTHLSLIISVAACVAAAAPAMATDEVPAPPVPPAAAVPAPTPPSASAPGCKDSSKPTSRISTSSSRAARSNVVRGTASDAKGCGVAGRGSVAYVTVSVQRKSGKRCQAMSSKGKLGSAKSCSSPKWLSAHGKKTWSFGLPKRLPHGSYVVHVRAHDSAGNVGSQRTLHVKL